jgi:hypothetical protein
MKRWKLLLGLLAAAGLIASALTYKAGIETPRPSNPVDASEETMEIDQSRSPKLDQSIAAFQAAGASPEFMAVLNDIQTSPGVAADPLGAAGPEELSRTYSPVPTRHGGERSSALIFALDAGNAEAFDALVAAGADPTADRGLFAAVAVRHYTGSLPDRNWDLSVQALDIYLTAGGDPTFADQESNLPLYGLALMEGNLPGALRLLEGGADIWARTRKWDQEASALALMTYSPTTMTFMAIAAERGAFDNAPPDAISRVIEFYADGFLDDDRAAPDPTFAHAGTAGMAEEVDKAELVLQLFRAIEPLAPENTDLSHAFV